MRCTSSSTPRRSASSPSSRSDARARAALALAALSIVGVGCGQDAIAVGQATATADYHRGELLAAIDRFVAAGRSAAGFGVLAAEVEALRPGMDESVAEEAERRMIVLALDPVEVLADRPLSEQVAALATTVWPFALKPGLDDALPTGALAQRVLALSVQDGETPDVYLIRLCGDVLAAECKFAVPELQGCAPCVGEKTWTEAVTRWEALDRGVAATADNDEALARPARWPMAGPGAVDWPAGIPLVIIEDDGDAVLDGVVLAPGERIAAFRRARTGGPLGVHLPAAARADQLEAMLADAARAGYREIVLQVRDTTYPWAVRGYRFAAAKKRRPGSPWRPTDTVQVVLRAVDAERPAGAARL
jgi:hypothetical protein